MKPELNWNYNEASSLTHDYCGQKDSMYYQPADYNQCQQYLNDRKTKKFPYRNDYDRKNEKTWQY